MCDPQGGDGGGRQCEAVQQRADRGGGGQMCPGDRSGPRQRAAHLPPSGHVRPLQGGHEPGAGLPGETPLSSLSWSSHEMELAQV